MTDLRNMSVEDMERYVLAGATGFVYDAAKEVFRRLREQEQQYDACHSEHVRDANELAACRRVANDSRTRLEQAESALLACQAGCAELRKAASDLVDFMLDSSAPIGPFTDRSEYPIQFIRLHAISHSTGSEIMAEEPK